MQGKLGKCLEDRFISYREFSIILLGGKLLPCSLRHEINLSGDLVFPSFYHLVLASIMYLTTSCIALHTKSNQKICRAEQKPFSPLAFIYVVQGRKRGAWKEAACTTFLLAQECRYLVWLLPPFSKVPREATSTFFQINISSMLVVASKNEESIHGKCIHKF